MDDDLSDGSDLFQHLLIAIVIGILVGSIIGMF